MELLIAVSCAAGWGSGLVVLGGVHATWTIGVTGGPNHGEHPFLVNVIHLLVAFWALKAWPPTAKWTYIGLVGGGVLLGIVAMRLVGAGPRALWSARAAMAALYVGLLGILLFGR
jgi:hypothetical protein